MNLAHVTPVDMLAILGVLGLSRLIVWGWERAAALVNKRNRGR